MSKNKQDGGDGVFRYLSKKAVRPLGFKRIRTSIGTYKSFSRSARGKRFPIVSKIRTKSSENLKTKLKYMNERIEGKTQKIEGYAVKLKEYQILKQSKIDNLKLQLKSTTDPDSILKINSNIAKIEYELKNKIDTISKKVIKAQKNLTKKLKKYIPKKEKYSQLINRKIYKSQKRLEKGFTKTCKDIVKTQPTKSSIACLQAYKSCKDRLSLEGITKCVNLETDKMGLPLDLKSDDVKQTMTKLANQHYIRIFKRRRHLREINRLNTISNLQKSMYKQTGTIRYGEKLKALNIRRGQSEFNKLGELSKDRVIYKNLERSNHKSYYSPDRLEMEVNKRKGISIV
jgi:hypothetical protein